MIERRTHISFFNSPQFFLGLFGHSGLIIEHLDRTCHLYSFHPAPNNGEPVGPGSIARIVNASDARDIDRLIHACMTSHEKDGREGRRGIQLSNGTTTWYEHIRRIIRMKVTVSQADAIEEFAQITAGDPPRFNIVTYSCEHFVNDALKAGGVVLCGRNGPLAHAIVPNFVYHQATADTIGVTGFRKIDFRSYFARTPEPQPAM